MEIEENPRKRRRRRKKSARRAAKRSNPAPRRRRRRRAARRNPAVAATRSNPPRRRRRRRAMRRSHGRRRGYRRNPSFPSFSNMGAWALGGGIARGAVYGVEKIPVENVYAQLGIKAAAPLVVGIGAEMAGFPRIAAGAFGAFGFQAPDLAMAGYHHYKNTSAPPQAKEGQKGLGMGSVRMPGTHRGFQSVRGGRTVVAK